MHRGDPNLNKLEQELETVRQANEEGDGRSGVAPPPPRAITPGDVGAFQEEYAGRAATEPNAGSQPPDPVETALPSPIPTSFLGISLEDPPGYIMANNGDSYPLLPEEHHQMVKWSYVVAMRVANERFAAFRDTLGLTVEEVDKMMGRPSAKVPDVPAKQTPPANETRQKGKRRQT